MIEPEIPYILQCVDTHLQERFAMLERRVAELEHRVCYLEQTPGSPPSQAGVGGAPEIELGDLQKAQKEIASLRAQLDESDDKLPDGVGRDEYVDGDGCLVRRWTTVNGHGRAEEQYAIWLPNLPAIVYMSRDMAERQSQYFYDTGQVREVPPVRRVIVIEMDDAAERKV